MKDLKQQILEEFRNKFAGLNSTPFGDVKGAIEDQLSAALDTLEQGVLGEVMEMVIKVIEVRMEVLWGMSDIVNDGTNEPYISFRKRMFSTDGFVEEICNDIIASILPPKEKECDYCEGMGLRTVSVETDDGRGEIQKEECSRCNGKGKVQMKTNYT